MITTRFSHSVEYDIDVLYQSISIESSYADASVSVLNKLERLVADVSKGVSDKILELKTLKTFAYPTKQMNKFLKVNPYDTIMELTVYRPPGLIVSYLEAVRVIERYHEAVANVEKRLLDPFIKWSANMLTEPSRLSELASVRDLDTIDSDSVIESLDALFDVRDKSDTAMYSDMVRRNSEWRDIIRSMRIIINRQNKLKPAKLNSKVDKVTEAVNKIISHCRTEPSVYSCSEQARANMADVVYELGREVSLVSRLYHIIKSLATALEDTSNKLVEL